MAATTKILSCKQHLIGKICFIEEKYSNKKLACLVYWQDDKPMLFQIDVRMLRRLLAPRLFEKVQENDFILECDAFVDENNNLSDIEITNIFETFDPISLL